MQVDLTDESEQLIHQHLATGEFATAEEVVAAALEQFNNQHTCRASDQSRPATRQGGQWHGQVKIADDFDELPKDIAKALGMQSS